MLKRKSGEINGEESFQRGVFHVTEIGYEDSAPERFVCYPLHIRDNIRVSKSEGYPGC